MFRRLTLIALLATALPAVAACSAPAGASQPRAAGPASSSAGAQAPSAAAPQAAPPAGATPPASTTTPVARVADERWDTTPVTLTFTGDVMLAGLVGERAVEEGPAAVFGQLSPTLREADIAVANVESAIGPASAQSRPEPKTYRFMAPPAAAGGLTDAGIDLVSLANNHTYDFGVPGIASTLETLDGIGVPHVGLGMDGPAAHAPVVLERRGMRIAFLAYTAVTFEPKYDNHQWASGPGRPGVAWADPEAITADVTAARRQADHVVVLLHAGQELTQELGRTQVAAAEAAIGAGATAVVGHHPHMLQGYEWDRPQGTLIAWSLGNTVFYPFAHEPSNSSALLTIELDGRGVRDLRWTPTYIDRKGTSWLVPADSAGGRAILRQVETAPRRAGAAAA